MATNITITATSTKNNTYRKRRYLPLLLRIGAFTSALLYADTAIYTSEQLMQIKYQMTKIDEHLSSLTDKITELHY